MDRRLAHSTVLGPTTVPSTLAWRRGSALNALRSSRHGLARWRAFALFRRRRQPGAASPAISAKRFAKIGTQGVYAL
jgi:hypothetical protein